MQILMFLGLTTFLSRLILTVRLDIFNTESGQIWVGIKERLGKESIEDGGFALPAKESVSFVLTSTDINKWHLFVK